MCLISFGCKTTTYDLSGTTALHVAILGKDIEIIDALVTQSADVNATDQVRIFLILCY